MIERTDKPDPFAYYVLYALTVGALAFSLVWQALA